MRSDFDVWSAETFQVFQEQLVEPFVVKAGTQPKSNPNSRNTQDEQNAIEDRLYCDSNPSWLYFFPLMGNLIFGSNCSEMWSRSFPNEWGVK